MLVERHKVSKFISKNVKGDINMENRIKGIIPFIVRNKEEYVSITVNENLVVCDKILSFFSETNREGEFILIIDENDTSNLFDNQANILVA